MKKIVSIVLALVLVLAIAAPAMAITGYVSPVTQKTASAPLAIDMYLVSDDAAGLGLLGLSAIASNKAYVMNEVVYGRVDIAGNPKTTWAEYDYAYTNLVISSNAAVLVNAVPYSISTKGSNVLLSGGVGAVEIAGTVTKDEVNNTITWGVPALSNYSVLFSGVVQGQGSIVAELMGGMDKEYFAGVKAVMAADHEYFIYNDLGVKLYRVIRRSWGADDSVFVDVYNKAGDTMIGNVEFNRNDKDVCTAIKVNLAGSTDSYVFSKNQAISTGVLADCFVLGGAVACSSIDTDPAKAELYKTLRGIYDSVMGFFGFDYDAKGELIDAHFTSKMHNFYAKDEVAVNLYTSAITVPDPEVEIPQTGDAATTIGFVMVAMAIVAAAAVAYKKVRA